jgi:uncharacterized membrane protein
MKEFFISFFSTLASFLIIDGAWLFIMSKRFYSVHLAPLMSQTPNLIPVIIFYLIYAAGLAFLILAPAVKNNTALLQVFIMGAVFGLVAYGTYDLTNQATLKDWPVIVTIVDLIWGTLLTGVVAIIAVAITKMFA